MIELLQIFLQLVLFLLFSYFPFNKYTTSISSTFSNEDYFSLNILNLIFFLLIISFLNISLKTSFIFFFLINTILLILNLKNIILEIKNKKNIFLKLFFFLICIFLFVNQAQNLQLGYDGLQIWKLKTNNFYNGYNYFESASQYDLVKQYPHLGSFLWAYFWENSIGNKEYFGRLFHIYIYIFSLFLLVSSLKKIDEIKKIILISLLIFFSYDIELNGYQEYLIFSLLIIATRFLLKITNKENRQKNLFYFYMFVISLILICYVKNEGIFYSAFFCIIFIFFKKLYSKKIILVSILTFVIILQFYISKNVHNLDNSFQFSLNDNIFNNQNLFSFTEIFYRISMTIFYSVHAMFKYPIILISFFAVLLSAYNIRKSKENMPLLFFFFLNIIFIFSIYIVTPFPFEWHLQTSIKRLYLQTSGLYIFLIINIINKKLIKI